MVSWLLLILVIAFIVGVLAIEGSKEKIGDFKKTGTIIFIILLVALLIASSLSAFIYH